ERIVGGAARRYIIICDSSKLVDRLGSALLPVEVSRFGWRNALARLEAQGCRATVRHDDGSQPFITEEGNYLIDCAFAPDSFAQPARLSQVIREIPGVADVGLFLGMVDLLLIARGAQ